MPKNECYKWFPTFVGQRKKWPASFLKLQTCMQCHALGAWEMCAGNCLQNIVWHNITWRRDAVLLLMCCTNFAFLKFSPNSYNNIKATASRFSQTKLSKFQFAMPKWQQPQLSSCSLFLLLLIEFRVEWKEKRILFYYFS